ncbi:glutaminase [Aequorivita lipolytica]|uniref:Glutaminase n=1 Tax=Aequorivita lipolytica TaxID=153267 RepID=A0A5C6YQE5_9FLAO|nr:glutaminase [Aequorivita lipolytica]TXD69165.1 glutaminase [Aequorivita lipolytica]SRX51254.1 Thermolabile glutaminase [Aequorivita lipolytica]
MVEYQTILEEIHESLKNVENTGEVASYIPELANVSKDKFGIHLQLITGENFAVGDASEKFSIQSISKVLSLVKAFQLIGNDLWERVDVEPSGNPFNHLSLLELENGIPRNPLINSGAIVIADVLLSHLKNPKEDFLNFVRELTHDESIHYNEKIAESERVTGFNNYAAANLLKAYGNLNNKVEDVLDFYFHQCSIMMDCRQLTNAFFVFANKGKCIKEVQHLTPSQVKRINAIMLTCGFYDEAGEFAFEVGLPGKSGVGGGIVALLPHCYTIATWAPALNPKGNSYLGMQALEQFTTKTKLSIF